MENIFNKKNCYKEFEGVHSDLLYGNFKDVPNPVISILMPVYKRPDTFRTSLGSALHQVFNKPYEIVVVDNYDGEGESPNLMIVKEAASPNIMYYHNKKNLGMFGNWNRCVELARADYVTFCHDDDMLLPNCLSRLMEIQNITGRKCILSRYNKIDEQGNYIERYEYPHYFYKILKEKNSYEYTLYNQFISSMGFGVGCLFNRECMLEIGGYNKEYYPSADFALHACYTYYYGCVINNIPTFNYRVAHNESMTAYRFFARTNRIIRYYISCKINIPKCWMNRVRMAIYRLSSISFEIDWGHKNKTIVRKPRLSDKIIYKIACLSNRFKGFSFR